MYTWKFNGPHARCNEQVRVRQLRTFNDLSALIHQYVIDPEARREILAAAQAYAAAEYAVAATAPPRSGTLECAKP